MEKNYDDDAFGQALLACYNGETTTYIVERDDNYVEASDLSVYFDMDNQEFGPDRVALDQIQPGMRVLDIGCGAGRHSLYLQERGVQAVGIDRSKLAIEVCKKRGLKLAYDFDIAELGTLANLKPRFMGDGFDRIIMLGHNFGLFGSFEKAQQLLHDMARVTKPDAKILATSRNPSTTNPFHLKYQEWNRSRGRMPCQIGLRVRFRNFVGSWLDYLFVSEEELQAILAGTPWHLESTQYAHDKEGASYLMVLAR